MIPITVIAAVSPDVHTMLSVVLIVFGALLVVVGIPLALRKIPMNGNLWAGYGMRFPNAYKSTENWYAINAFGGKAVIVDGIITLLAGVASLYEPVQSMRALPGLIVGFLVISMLTMTLVCYLYSGHFGDNLNEPAPSSEEDRADTGA